MKVKVPFKRLVRLNFIITIYFSLFGFFTSLPNADLDIHKAMTRSFLGGLVLLVNSFSNLLLFWIFDKRVINSEKKLRLQFLSLSFLLSMIDYLVVIHGYALIRGKVNLTVSSLLSIIIISVLVNVLILTLQHYIIMQEEKIQTDLENSQLKIANAETANQLLKQQIHPHFLFNALNILKSLYKVNAKEGERYLICLSNFLRASVSNNNIKVIPLKEELKLCQDYLEMQKIRFGEGLTCSINIDTTTIKNGFVPSFSIQPLLENAIKHNELTEESPLHIVIEQEGERIKVSNNLQRKISNETSTGSGLVNLSERYRILADEELIIEENETTFSVSLKILSHEDNNH